MANYDDGFGRPQMQFSLPPLTHWVRRLLIVIIVLSIIKLFGIWDWAWALMV